MTHLQQHLEKSFGLFFFLSHMPQIADSGMSSIQYAYTVRLGKVYIFLSYMPEISNFETSSFSINQ